MNIKEYEAKSILKFYHIILLGCLLGVILIVNSDYVNNKKAENKFNKEKSDFFEKIVYGRKLEETPIVNNPVGTEEEEEEYETDAVCKRSDKELRDYYNNTATLSDLGIEEGPIKCEDKDKDYIKALIALIRSLVDGSKEEDDDSEGDEINDNEELEPEHRLRNLIEFNDEVKNNLITYLKSAIILVAALAMSILCIFGWIICCFCNCCNCCCCCCCKKPGCKIPCFIWTFLLYAAVVAVCFYGLTQTNKIFTGLANTECSILNFFDEILFGEQKQTTPRWAGIEGINSILNEISGVIREMGPSTYETLEDGLEQIHDEEETFEEILKGSGENFYDNGNYKNGKYSKDYTGKGLYQTPGDDGELEGRCVIDLVYLFGRYEEDTEDPTKGSYKPDGSLLNLWNLEYSTVAGVANDNLNKAKDGFKDILDDNLDKIQDVLDDAQDKFNDLKKPFDDIYQQLASSIYDYSMLIDDYGKDGVKLCFGALALINIVLAVLMFLICMCSGKMCVNCCCCRCMCKFLTHILWNVLAILMIVTFLIGSIIGLLGKIGGDVMSVISYVVSLDNFNSEEPLLINKIGSANQYLNCCMNGDGDIAGQLDISESIGSFDEIYVAQRKIDEAIDNFTSLIGDSLIYKYYKELLDKRINYQVEEGDINGGDMKEKMEKKIFAFNKDHEDKLLEISMITEALNEAIENYNSEKKESWSLKDGDQSKICDPSGSNDNQASITLPAILHPKTCKPLDRDWVKVINLQKEPDDDDPQHKAKNELIKGVYNYATLVSDMVGMVEQLNGEYKETLENIKLSYKRYLGSFVNVLKDFSATIQSITGILEEYIGSNSKETFSFLNGQFIGRHLKIVLKYLKYSLGKDLYTVGMCLIIVGCSLIFSISSTILTIVIINIDIDQKKIFAQQEAISQFATDSVMIEPTTRRHSRRRSKAKY